MYFDDSHLFSYFSKLKALFLINQNLLSLLPNPSSTVFAALVFLHVWPFIEIWSAYQGVSLTKKTDSPSPGSYQLPVASWLWVGLHIYPLLHAGLDTRKICLRRSNLSKKSPWSLHISAHTLSWKLLSKGSWLLSLPTSHKADQEESAQ